MDKNIGEVKETVLKNYEQLLKDSGLEYELLDEIEEDKQNHYWNGGEAVAIKYKGIT